MNIKIKFPMVAAMALALFSVAAAEGLPDDYGETTFLQSSGAQWIDTGIVPDSTTVVSLDWQSLKAVGESFQVLAGTKDESLRNMTVMIGSANNLQGGVLGSSGPASPDVAWPEGTRHEVTLDAVSNAIYFDGNKVKDTTAEVASLPSLYLFARHSPTAGAEAFACGRLYGCRIRQGGDLVRDYVPARRKADGAAGLYDRVTGDFSRSDGTSEFEAPIPESAITALSYVETTGTQWIDTQVKPDRTTVVSLDWQSLKAVGESFQVLAGTKDESLRNMTAMIGSANNLQGGVLGTHGPVSPDVAWSEGDRHEVTLDAVSNAIYFDGNKVKDTTAEVASLPSLYLFARHSPTAGAEAFACGRLYGCQIWQGGVLVRDYVPARRNADGAVGVYDRVIGLFDLGGGTLVAGSAPESIEIVGSPESLGAPNPGYGFVESLVKGRDYTFDPPADVETDEMKLHCTGWEFAPNDGEALRGTGSANLTYKGAGRLTWLLDVQYKVVALTSGGGTVDKPEQWLDCGSNTTITATGDDGRVFAHWQGDVPKADARRNPLTLRVDGPKTVTAIFVDAAEVPRRRCTMTVAGYSGKSTLTDFPLLVKISESAIDGFRYADCAEGGDDISFVDANGNVLPHEIDTWNPAGVSFVWVKLPALSARSTTFDFRWCDVAPPLNDPEAVWSDYVGVWHLGRYDEAKRTPDSTGHGLAAFSTGDLSPVAAKVGDGLTGESSLCVPDYEPEMAVGRTFTVSCWFKASTFAAGSWPAVLWKEQNDSGFGALVAGSTTRFVFQSGAGSGTVQVWSDCKDVTKNWQHVAFVSSEAENRSYPYLDGEKCASEINACAGTCASSFYFGGGSQIDECRVRRGACSSDWIKAEYDQVADDGFVTAGEVECRSPAMISVTSSADRVGTVEPAYGNILEPEAGKTYVFTNREAVVSMEGGNDQMVCTGWELYDLYGNLLRSSADDGEQLLGCSHIYEAGKGVRFVWRWQLRQTTVPLPAEYEPVEYVSGSASTVPEELCYVDTGVVPSGAIPEVWLKYKFGGTADNVYAFGSWNGSRGTAVGFMQNQIRYRVADVAGLCGQRDQAFHEVKLNTAEGTIVDGESVGDPQQVSDPEDELAYYLLARHHSAKSTGVDPSDCAVCYAKIWLTVNGVRRLVRDFTPCRRLKDGVGGFWDSVAGKFYPNSNPRAGAPVLVTGEPCEESYYVLPAVGASQWKDETEGPSPEIRLATTGAVLTRGVDYELAWLLTDSAQKGYVLVTGKGEHLGHNAAIPYDLFFDPAKFGATFEKLDYLESDGAAYIRTGIVPNGRVPTVRITYRMNPVDGAVPDSKYAFGSWKGSGGTIIGVYDGRLRYRVNDQAGFYGTADLNVHTVSLNTSQGTFIDGNLVDADMKDVPDPSDKEYYLFGRNYASASESPTRCRIYHAKIWLDGALARDFVPCRVKTSGVLGLFDKVEGRFYINAGTGSFRYYQPLKYVESREGQYVKTGVVPTVGCRPSVELKFQLVRFTDVVTVFGYYAGSFGTYLGTMDTDGGLVFRQRVGNVGGSFDQAGDPRPDGNVHVWQFNTPDGSVLDGVNKTGSDFTNLAEPSGCLEYYLFARNGSNWSIERPSASRVYACKVWLDGKLVSDLIPVRCDDGVAGLYDEVRRVFLRSESGGDLTGGPEIPKPGFVLLIR